jgi:hypothetical protein
VTREQMIDEAVRALPDFFRDHLASVVGQKDALGFVTQAGCPECEIAVGMVREGVREIADMWFRAECASAYDDATPELRAQPRQMVAIMGRPYA